MKLFYIFIILQITSIFCYGESEVSKPTDLTKTPYFNILKKTSPITLRRLSPKIVSDDALFSESSLISCYASLVVGDRSGSFRSIKVKLASDKPVTERDEVYLLFNGKIYKSTGVTIRVNNTPERTYIFRDLDFTYNDISQENRNFIVYVTTKNKQNDKPNCKAAKTE